MATREWNNRFAATLTCSTGTIPIFPLDARNIVVLTADQLVVSFYTFTGLFFFSANHQFFQTSTTLLVREG
jgi:hypothetical protein